MIRGNLLVIPIEESLIYVQPLYLRAEGGRIPELKRVIVAYENQVVMTETLEGGLAQIFGAGAAEAPEPRRAAPTEPAGPANELIARALRHFEQAQAAQRRGDWARYGEEVRRLGETLTELREQSGVDVP